MLRIFIGESERSDHKPLYEAIVLKARELQLGGATVLRCPMGFGRSSHLHSAKILRLSEDLPKIIEIVDSQAKIDHMPYADASFDRVFSSFMFHHLAADEKSATLAEIRRVLKVGGSLHLLDFVREHSVHAGTEEHGRWIHRHGPVAERIEGRMTALMDEAGLVDAKEVSRGKNFFGPIAYYRAESPAA